MATEKRRPGQQKKGAVKFQADSREEQRANTASMANDLRAHLSYENQQSLEKTVKAQTIKRELKGKYDQTKVVFSAKDHARQADGIEVKSYRRIQDTEQKELAQIDPYISAIITNRCAQSAVIGYPSESKFDKGSRALDLDPPDEDDFETDEEYERECLIHEAHQKAILKWTVNCGTTDSDIINQAFQGGDLTFKSCTLREFLEAQVRNLLTFGRCATQIFRNEEGLPVMFRPVPVETIYNVVEGEKIHIGTSEDTADQSKEDAEEYNALEPDERPIAYVQRVDGRNINFFTEDDLHVWHWQKQALFDLNGYPLSPIEQAIYMVFVHQQTLNYLRNQFVKGMANKGMITMESTLPGVEISDADLEDFRQQFHNFVTRNDNSAVIPVIGGPVKVNYIPLSSTPRDMEFLQVEEHVIRALCSAFQISPQEMGYGHLSLPQGLGGGSGAGKQEDIIKGEERGLRMLLDIIYDGLNKIIYLNFPDAEDKYRISYVGVGEDTRDAVIERQQMELNTTATMNSLMADSEKMDAIPFGGDMPLASAFQTGPMRFMTMGEIREYYLKVDGASKDPALDFYADPAINEAYQALRTAPLQMQQAQAAMGAEQQQMELEAGEQQMQQGMQQPAPGEEGGEAPPPDQNAVQQAQPAAGGVEPTEKSMVSLRDKWLESQKLQKSMRTYFAAFHQSQDH